MEAEAPSLSKPSPLAARATTLALENLPLSRAGVAWSCALALCAHGGGLKALALAPDDVVADDDEGE